MLIKFTGTSKLFGRIISHKTQLIKSEFRNFFKYLADTFIEENFIESQFD